MGKYLVTMGDFLKNAGIVGLNYMLDMSDAESGKDYGIKMQNRPVDGLELYEQGLWLDEDFVLSLQACQPLHFLPPLNVP